MLTEEVKILKAIFSFFNLNLITAGSVRSLKELVDISPKVMCGITSFIAEYNVDVPIIFTGDFNCNIASLAAKHIISTGLEDTSIVALSSTKSIGGIDFIFTSENDFIVYEVFKDISKIDGDLPSDHYPVIAVYDFK